MYETATLTKIPANFVQVKEEEFSQIEKLLDAIQEDDDVQDVYTNVEII